MEADGGGSRRVERHRPAHAGGEISRGSRQCELKVRMIVAITRTVTRFCGHVTASPIHLHNAIGNASSLTSVSKRAQTSASSMRAQQHNTENTAQWRSSSITERRSCRREQHLLQAAPCNTAVHVCIAATTPLLMYNDADSQTLRFLESGDASLASQGFSGHERTVTSNSGLSPSLLADT